MSDIDTTIALQAQEIIRLRAEVERLKKDQADTDEEFKQLSHELATALLDGDELRADNKRLTRTSNAAKEHRDALLKRIIELEGQHKGLVLNNAILRERPDLPLNRIPAARAVTKLYEENERLRAALEYIAKGGLAYPEKHAMAALSQATGNNHE